MTPPDRPAPGPDHASSAAHSRAPLWRALAWGTAIGLCAAVFASYGRADFLRTLADQLWSCF